MNKKRIFIVLLRVVTVLHLLAVLFIVIPALAALDEFRLDYPLAWDQVEPCMTLNQAVELCGPPSGCRDAYGVYWRDASANTLVVQAWPDGSVYQACIVRGREPYPFGPQRVLSFKKTRHYWETGQADALLEDHNPYFTCRELPTPYEPEPW